MWIGEWEINGEDRQRKKEDQGIGTRREREGEILHKYIPEGDPKKDVSRIVGWKWIEAETFFVN